MGPGRAPRSSGRTELPPDKPTGPSEVREGKGLQLGSQGKMEQVMNEDVGHGVLDTDLACQ